MKKLVLAAVVMLFLTTTAAELTGSLKAMSKIKITVLEYFELRVRIASLERLAEGDTTIWSAKGRVYESVVKIMPYVDLVKSELRLEYNPVDRPIFKTTKEAKGYCEGLILIESIGYKTLLGNSVLPDARPLMSDVNFHSYYKGIHENTVLQAVIWSSEIEDSSDAIVCKAKQNKDGQIDYWSYNVK
jgi:hypothetical protein